MRALNFVAAAMLAISTAAPAQTASAPSASEAASALASMTEGEVRKVDKEAGKVTLRHAPIESMGMPAMTMVFRVADPKMLEQLKEGEKIRFSAARLNGAITLMSVEVSN